MELIYVPKLGTPLLQILSPAAHFPGVWGKEDLSF